MSYRRVLVILKGYLGDAVMATPLLKGLTAQTNTQVHVLTTRSVITLFEDTFPNVSFHVVRSIQNPFELSKQAAELRSHNFDLALVVNRSFRSALLSWMARIPIRVGHKSDLRSAFLTKSIPYDEDRFEAACYLDLARAAGIELEEVHPFLIANPELAVSIQEKLGNATIGVQPGARHSWKRVPMSVFVDVVLHLEKEYSIVLLGGSDEEHYGYELANSVDHKPINLVGALSLKETIAATSQLKLMIGSDTGLMHIAAAAGCPTVTMFGPVSESKWGHRYPPHQVLRKADKKISSFTSKEILDAVRRALCS